MPTVRKEDPFFATQPSFSLDTTLLCHRIVCCNCACLKDIKSSVGLDLETVLITFYAKIGTMFS